MLDVVRRTLAFVAVVPVVVLHSCFCLVGGMALGCCCFGVGVRFVDFGCFLSCSGCCCHNRGRVWWDILRRCVPLSCSGSMFHVLLCLCLVHLASCVCNLRLCDWGVDSGRTSMWVAFYCLTACYRSCYMSGFFCSLGMLFVLLPAFRTT